MAFHRARLGGGHNWQLPNAIMIVKGLRPARPGGCSVSPIPLPSSLKIMSAPTLYSPENTNAAYQLNWSLSVFGKESLPSPQICIDSVRESVARDNFKILEFRHRPPNVAQFFVSSQPQTSPSQIIRSVKGRWQNISRPIEPIEFRRNYRISAVGTSNSEVLDAYVQKQPVRHPMADSNAQSMIEAIQFHDMRVDLTSVIRSSHGEYRYGLHIVIESESDWHEVRQEVLSRFRRAVIDACEIREWQLARIGLLSNHLHILVGPRIDDSPGDVALVFLNNLADTQGMKPIFRFSYFVGTFGEYDRGAIWNSLGGHAASARTGRTESFPAHADADW